MPRHNQPHLFAEKPKALTMKNIFLIVATLALLALPAKGQQSHDLMIMNMVAPASLTSTAQTAAVYFSVMNMGKTDDTLLRITTASATSATLHEMRNENDVMKMRPLDSLSIPAGSTVELKPASLHIMLTGLNSPLKTGEVIALQLTFEKSGIITIEVPVGDKASAHVHGAGG